jgi:hypothetical protein
VTPLRDLHFFTARISPLWTDATVKTRTESLILEMTAPRQYGNTPTKIQFHAYNMVPVHTRYGTKATANSIAKEEAANNTYVAGRARDAWSEFVAGSVRDCVVAGDPAAVFGYVHGDQIGYHLYVVHKDSLFVIMLFGAGGVADQALDDALGMMGSMTFALWIQPSA